MANHVLLFASALVPKALASLMTSFCIELAKPQNVSINIDLSAFINAHLEYCH